ncbi:hypothetical protein C8R45DRAFT_913864 [Mycena sanguinolenta]|nr:hypothetical protein C8R45DRAFT_913864 [Mycena sanguinolenta]
MIEEPTRVLAAAHKSQVTSALLPPLYLNIPVTFHPAKHPAESHNILPLTAAEILRRSRPNQWEQVDTIMQCSIGGRPEAGSDTTLKIVPNTNGFVNTVVTAWGEHRALIIRPDDVWLAIIAQFSFFVNGNAELLRANFVAHEGKRTLTIVSDSMDFALLSRQMGDLIHKNIVDPALRDWVLPSFSTTTTMDTTVGSMLMMAAMKKYFDYRMVPTCGIPRVTLEGEREDYALILRCLEKLKEYGLQTIAWYHLLFPVISQFVKAFDDPDSPENLEFWLKAACHETFGYGSHEWSGWITAFCVFSEQGEWRGPRLHTSVVPIRAPESMSARRFWSTYTSPREEKRPHLTLGITEYPVVDHSMVPAGYAEVDVMIGIDKKCAIVAGLVGMGFSSSRDLSLSVTGKNDTVRPVMAWWIYSKVDEGKRDDRRESRSRDYAPIFPPFFPTVQPFISSTSPSQPMPIVIIAPSRQNSQYEQGATTSRIKTNEREPCADSRGNDIPFSYSFSQEANEPTATGVQILNGNSDVEIDRVYTDTETP